MYNKIFLSLKKIICLVLLLFFYNVAFSQHYVGFTKEDLIMIKGENYTLKDGVITYNRPSQMVWGKVTDAGFESFHFDNNGKVNISFRFGLFSEEDVMKIVSYNNENFKKVNVGQKQGFFQWLDVQKGISLKLDVTSGMDKFYMGDYMIEKEQ